MSIQTDTIRDIMTLRGMTQRDLAEACGASTCVINNILQGRAPIGKAWAKRFNEALGISVYFLLTGEGDPMGQPSPHLEVSHNSGNSKNSITVQSNDVTALQAQNQALRSENAWLRSMVESLSKKSGD